MLFGRADVGRIFSVENFGIFLLAALPLFLIGCIRALGKPSFFTYILAAFITTPVFFGLTGSDGYGHRLVAFIPPAIVLLTLGLQVLIKKLNVRLLAVFTLLYTLNFADFFITYFYMYPKHHETRAAFANTFNQAYLDLASVADQRQLIPAVEEGLHQLHGEGALFFEAAYFDQPLVQVKLGETPPPGSVLLTRVGQLESTTTIPTGQLYLHTFPAP